MKDTTIKERILLFIKHQGITPSRFEKTCGLSNGYLRQLRSAPSVDKLESIISACADLNPDWLLTGEGEMLKSQSAVKEIDGLSNEEQIEIRRMVDTGEAIAVPVIHIDSVGGIHSGNTIVSPEYVERYIPMTGARQGDVAIYQSGNSMAPAIPSGALLLIREVEGWQEYIGYGDVFVLLLSDERRITKEIHRYVPDPQNYYWCVSYNPDVADEELPKSFVRRVYKVIKVLIDKGW